MNKKSKARRQPRRRPAARKVPEKPSRSRLRLIIAAAAAVVLAISSIVIYQLNRPQPVAAAPSAAPADGQLGRTVQENSRRLNDVPNAKATLSGWSSTIDGTTWLIEEVSTKLGSGGLTQSLKMESAG